MIEIRWSLLSRHTRARGAKTTGHLLKRHVGIERMADQILWQECRKAVAFAATLHSAKLGKIPFSPPARLYSSSAKFQDGYPRFGAGPPVRLDTLPALLGSLASDASPSSSSDKPLVVLT